MYDELVKRLREKAGAFDYDGRPDIACDYEQATDAIEQLSMKLHGDEAAIAGMKREIERMVVTGKPKWIPVAEALPEDGEYLVICKLNSPYAKPFIEMFRFSSNLEAVDKHNFKGANRSGWYYYDDEDGYIEVVTVTHWMTLPEPPKEE